MSRIFNPNENIYDAIESIRTDGYAAVEGTASSATPFCERILVALAAYPEVDGITSYTNVDKNGYLYFVYDSNMFDHGSACRMVKAVDQQSN